MKIKISNISDYVAFNKKHIIINYDYFLTSTSTTTCKYWTSLGMAKAETSRSYSKGLRRCNLEANADTKLKGIVQVHKNSTPSYLLLADKASRQNSKLYKPKLKPFFLRPQVFIGMENRWGKGQIQRCFNPMRDKHQHRRIILNRIKTSYSNITPFLTL